MKKSFNLFIILLITCSFIPLKLRNPGYDKKLVEISTAIYKNEKYIMVAMQRDGKRIKAKYFAAKDNNGKSVYERFKSWSSGQDIILVSSGTYMNNSSEPVGLTIDNGVMVNNALEGDMDGLVIVYATGGIVVSNLEEGNLSMKCKAVDKIFDIRKVVDKTQFVECAKDEEATVFQTHLLVYKNELRVKPPNISIQSRSGDARERRFLAACKDEDGKIIHIVVHSPDASTLYDGTKKVFEFLKVFKEMQEVVFMINLDTGAQDVFQLYDEKNNLIPNIKGRQNINVAANLLTYYYQ